MTVGVVRILLFLVVATACIGQLGAVPLTLLTLDDGLGNLVSIDETGAVLGVGSFSTVSSAGTGAHKTISWSGTLGQFDLNITTGRGGLAEVRPALINLNSINVASVGAGTLNVLFADTGFTGLTPGTLTLAASGTETATAVGSSVIFTALGRSGGPIVVIGSLGPFSSSSFSATKDFANPIGTHGDLGERVVMHFAHKGEIDTGFTISNVSDVPEAQTIALLGTALFLLGRALRRKILTLSRA